MSPDGLVCPPSEVSGGNHLVCDPRFDHRLRVLDQHTGFLTPSRAPSPLSSAFDHPLEPWSVAVATFTCHAHCDALPRRHSADISTVAGPPGSG
jgi:hypothetical protein